MHSGSEVPLKATGPSREVLDTVRKYKMGFESFIYADGMLACTITSFSGEPEPELNEAVRREIRETAGALKVILSACVHKMGFSISHGEEFHSFFEGKVFNGPALRFYIAGAMGAEGASRLRSVASELKKIAVEVLGLDDVSKA